MNKNYWPPKSLTRLSVPLRFIPRLQGEPDATGKTLFLKLQKRFPGVYDDGQLRTLQRRVREWRMVLARELVFATDANTEEIKTAVPPPVQTCDSNTSKDASKENGNGKLPKNSALENSDREQSEDGSRQLENKQQQIS